MMIIINCRLGAIMTAEYVLELGNVFHSGQVLFTVIIMCQHVQQNFNGRNHSGQFHGDVHASR